MVTTAAKTTRRNLRVSPTDDVLFREAAAAVGESVSTFLVESGRARAELILAGRTRFVLEADAWETFAAALDQPAELKQPVVDLLRRPRPE
jgi:uncharacterized protein (DUF1778 family)